MNSELTSPRGCSGSESVSARKWPAGTPALAHKQPTSTPASSLKQSVSAPISPRKRSALFAVIVVTCIASSMQETALSTALPPIITDLGIEASLGQWLTSGYNLAMGIIMPLSAFLVTRVPTRRLYVGSLALFTVGILLAAIAPDFSMLMAARIVQACGNGIMVSMAQVVILTIYPKEEQGRAMGWYGLSVGAAPVVAPTLAGIIVDAASWRWIFYLSLAVSVAALVFAFFTFADVLETSTRDFDVTSFVLSVLAFGGLTLGVGNLSSVGITSPITWVPILVGTITGYLFTKRQLSQEEPFLDLRVLKTRSYRLALIGSMLLYFVMMGSAVIMPLYVQDTLELSATVSSLVMMPGSIAMAMTSPFAGRIYDAIGIRRLFLVGSVCLTASCAGMAVLPLDASVWISSVLNAVRTVSIGCLMMPLVTWGTGSLEGASSKASGTALLTSLRTIAGAVGAALFVGVMEGIAASSEVAGASASAASMHGLNVTYLLMTVVAAAMLAIGVVSIKDKG